MNKKLIFKLKKFKIIKYKFKYTYLIVNNLCKWLKFFL